MRGIKIFAIYYVKKKWEKLRIFCSMKYSDAKFRRKIVKKISKKGYIMRGIKF